MSEELVNFYNQLPNELKVSKMENVGFKNHGIKLPCRLLISGPSGRGKTLSILNFLKLCQDKKKGTFDHITIFTKKNEQLYEYMKYKNPKNVSIHEINDGDTIPGVDTFDTGLRHFIIFDDLINDRHLFPIIKDFFIRCRKTKPYPISICFLTQDFRATDATIRKNCTNTFIFKPSTNRELKVLFQDLPLLNNKYILDKLDSKTNDMFNFANIDNDENTIRINFGKIVNSD